MGQRRAGRPMRAGFAWILALYPLRSNWSCFCLRPIEPALPNVKRHLHTVAIDKECPRTSSQNHVREDILKLQDEREEQKHGTFALTSFRRSGLVPEHLYIYRREVRSPTHDTYIYSAQAVCPKGRLLLSDHSIAFDASRTLLPASPSPLH